MINVLMATTNVGKQCELRKGFAGLGLTLVAPQDIRLMLDVEETGASFSENALLKARAYRDGGNMSALADDSGLCVDALDGSPGILSARYGVDDVTRCARLLESLEGIAFDKRTAEFVCVLAFSAVDGREWIAEGRIRGSIALFPRGQGGFGYDPIFETADGRTFAEMSGDDKNRLSPRSRAIVEARKAFEEMSRQS